MNQLLGASFAGLVSGIKCTPYMVAPLTRMLTLLQARSFVNSKVSEFPVGNLRMGETGRQKETDFLPFFTKEGKAQRNTGGGRTGIYHGPVFTGEVEKRYLDYLGNFDWESLQKHMIDFPRRRSEEEARVIFDKWAAHFGRKYPSPELKEMRFPAFKKDLALCDEANSFGGNDVVLDEKADIEYHRVSCYEYSGRNYLVKGFLIPYHSFTPLSFCELSGSYGEDYYESDAYGEVQISCLYDDYIG